MSDETTRDLLGGQLDQLIGLVKNLTEKHEETDARVERLERVLEERLYDTRPISEAVRAQVQELSGRVGAIETEMTGMRAEMTGMRAEMAETRTEMAASRTEMTATHAQITEMLTLMIEMLKQMTEMRTETSNGFRLVDRKIGVLGKTL